jgi:hypothetical protein
MQRPLALTALVLAGLAAASCAKQVNAPEDRDNCYEIIPQKDGSLKFYSVAKNQTSMAACAAQLDAVRFRFLSFGSQRTEIDGYYNDTYLFIDPSGMTTSRSYDGGRFYAYGRGDDGRLTLPGAIPQPGPAGGGVMITQNPKDEANVAGARPAAKK